MSRTEHRKGKLRKIGNKGVTLEDTCKTLHEQITNEPLEKYYKDYTEYMSDCDEYVVANGSLYQILEDCEIDEDSDIAEASVFNDGIIEYEVRFYNGGTSFSEMIEEAIEKMEKQS